MKKAAWSPSGLSKRKRPWASFPPTARVVYVILSRARQWAASKDEDQKKAQGLYSDPNRLRLPLTLHPLYLQS
ncbi:MAG: hypothetical protein ACUVXD_10670 [Thermodesulfobacteriota bacterium]